MRDWEDDYLDAWDLGGATAVNKLISDRHSNTDDQVRVAMQLEDTGRWEVLKHRSSRTRQIDRAVVIQYLGA